MPTKTKCPNCDLSNKQGGSTTLCDGCKTEIHLSCIGMNSDDLRVTRSKWKNVKVICNACNRFMGELGDIKSLFDQLSVDLKSKLSELEQKVDQNTNLNSITQSIKNLESDIKELKTTHHSQPLDAANDNFEDVLQELGEREKRKKNVILFNLSESSSTVKEDRASHDSGIIKEILSKADTALSTFKSYRIGKYSPDKIRPLKIVLGSEDEVHRVVNKAKYIKATDKFKNISISFDRTPRQVDYYRQIKKTLNDRISKGDKNLKLKYVNGTPKIITLN